MMVPAGTPRPVIDRLNGALLAALRSPQVRQKLDEQGTQVLGSSPDEYVGFMRAETERWLQVARKAKLEPQ
jgi:tripartite-type tricarboxylate transporter receptor subunit TctC